MEKRETMVAATIPPAENREKWKACPLSAMMAFIKKKGIVFLSTKKT
jgi:hypothetical protein